MADSVDSSPSPIFAIDRAIFISRCVLIQVIAFHVKKGAIVQVEDGKQPAAVRLRYEVRPMGDDAAAARLIDAHGRQIGIFANVAALVAHAEAVTR